VSSRDWLAHAERIDAAAYAAVARIDLPPLDQAMSRLSRAADYSRLWLGAAALLSLFGGSRGRRAAIEGFVAIGVTSAIVNTAMKPISRRPRPEREVLSARHVRMPVSLSFPSGHAASFAFATGVARVEPRASPPLHGLAAAVAYSRVHTGVHFPADVIAGSLIGVGLARLTGILRDRRSGTSHIGAKRLIKERR
jgi:undecaprenyl-diphosphatase